MSEIEAIGPYEGDIWFARTRGCYVAIKDDREIGFVNVTDNLVYAKLGMRLVYREEVPVTQSCDDFIDAIEREKHLSMAAICIDHNMKHRDRSQWQR